MPFCGYSVGKHYCTWGQRLQDFKNSWKPQSREHGRISSRIFLVQMHFEKDIQGNTTLGSLEKVEKSAMHVI